MRLLTGLIHEVVDVNPLEKVSEFAERVRSVSGIPPETMILKYKGTEMNPQHRVAFYGISNGETVDLELNFRGD